MQIIKKELFKVEIYFIYYLMITELKTGYLPLNKGNCPVRNFQYVLVTYRT